MEALRITTIATIPEEVPFDTPQLPIQIPESYFFEEIPKKIKIRKIIKESLENETIKKFLKKAAFLKSLTTFENEDPEIPTYLKKSWKTMVNGSAAIGNFLVHDDEKLHGYGKLIDIQGHYIIGNFNFGNFKNGLIFTSDGFIYSISDCRNNRYLDCGVQMYTNWKMEFVYSGKIKKGKMNGKGKISFLKMKNWFLSNPDNMIMYNNVECKNFKNGYLNGKAWIVDARFPHQSLANSAFEIKVEFKEGIINYIFFSLSNSLKLIHDTPASEFNDHNCLILQKYDRSVSYYGKLDGFFENKKSVKITEDFISLENKHYQRAIGTCYYDYPSHDAFMEITWRFEEEFDDDNAQVQVGEGIQYMQKSGVMIYGRWVRNYQLEKPSVWRFDKVITASGGCYQGEASSDSRGLYFEFSSEIKEKPRYRQKYGVKQVCLKKNLNRFHGKKGFKRKSKDCSIEEGSLREFKGPGVTKGQENKIKPNVYRNFITVMVDSTDTIFSDIHVTSGESLEKVKNAYVFNNGIYAEGGVSLDKEFNTCCLTGKGIYVENDLNFLFEGEMEKDDFKKGRLSSGYAVLEGVFDDFVFREGKAKLRFHGGIVFEGCFKNQSVNGQGKLVYEGEVIEEGEWKNGVLEPERKWMITHGDKNQRYHRLCLFKLKDRNSFVDSDSLEPTSGKIPNFSEHFPDNKDKIFKMKNLDVRTLTIYGKIFFFKKTEFQFTDKGNIKLVRSIGEMACSMKTMSLKRYEMIKNPETYGNKTLSIVSYNFPKSFTRWKKNGMFSKECHKVITLQVNFLNGIFRGLFEISQKDFHTVEEIKFFNYDFTKDLLDFKKRLKNENLKNIEELKFCYYVFRDLDERLVIRLKSDDEILGKNKVKGRDKFNGVILDAEGGVSFGEIERCFLNGKGTKIFCWYGDFTNSKKNKIIQKKLTQEIDDEEINSIFNKKIFSLEKVYPLKFVVREEGTYFCDNLNGEAKIFYSNGGVYTGETRLGKRHGRGRMQFPNGESYEGDWFGGVKHGSGEYKWGNSGEMYEGEFKMNMMWGSGKYWFSRNGYTLVGEFWKNEVKEGCYEVFDSEGNLVRSLM